MKSKIKEDVMQQLLKPRTSKEMFWKAFEIFKITKKHIVKQLVLLGVCALPACVIGLSENTVDLFSDISEMIMGVILAIFGVVFTGYTLLQAFINNDFLLRLVENTVKEGEAEKSKLQETNENFVAIMMLNLAAIIVTLFLGIIVKALPSDFNIFAVHGVNNAVATVAMEIYLVFLFTIIWETKSFIFNIFQLFNMHSVSRIIQILQGEEEE